MRMAVLNVELRARAYSVLELGFRWMPRKLRTFVQAIWLGLLDRESLNRITLDSYSLASGQWGSREFNLESDLWPWEADAVRAFLVEGQHVLVVGAGGGREAIALAKLGFQVTACDPCADLTRACKRNAQLAGVALEVVDAPADELPAALVSYDAIIVGRGCYHHIIGSEHRVELLRQCRAQVGNEGRLFLFDFHTRVEPSPGHARIQSVANWVRRMRRHPERVEVGDWLSLGWRHGFTRAEIESEFARTGFRLARYAVSPFDETCRLAHAVGIATQPTALEAAAVRSS